MSKIIKKQFVNLTPPKIFESTPDNNIKEKIEDEIDELKNKLEKLKKEYDQNIKKAKLESQNILSKAKEEGELLKNEILSKAKEEGFDLGYNEGMQRAQKEIGEWSQQLKQLLEKIEDNQKNILQKNKKFIVTLVKLLVKRIISKELKEDSDNIVLRTIEEFSKEISGKSTIKILLSKDDYQALFNKNDYIKRQFIGIDKITIKPDNTLSKGDIFIDTEIGSYDLIIENKIKEAFKLLDEGSGGN